MTRGDIVTVAPPGAFGKPRPALIIQAVPEVSLEHVTVLLITTDLLRAPLLRVPISPTRQNGLRHDSEIAVDNIQTFSVAKVGNIIGHIEADALSLVEFALEFHLGLNR